MPEVPGAGAEAPPSGGGVAEAISQLDAGLAKLAEATTQNPKVPDGAKAALVQALEAFRAFTDQLSGGVEEESPQANETMSAQGGPKGVPLSMGRPA